MKTVVVRLKEGQGLEEEIEKLVRSNNISAGVILSGVGSLSKAKLRLPVISGKTRFLELKNLEIDSLHGTLSSDGNHIHLVVSDIKGEVRGGHLEEGCIVRTTCEIVVGVLEDKKFIREMDDNTGFKELSVTSLVEAKLYTDGGSRGNPGPSAGAFVICKMNDNVVEKSGFYIGITTNNQAEYQALIRGLQKAVRLGVQELNVFMDSELIIKQLNGFYKVKHINIKPLFQKVHDLTSKFTKITFVHVRREDNAVADKEVNRILDQQITA